MAKSYFAILGIARDATEEEVKSAYRRLVKEFHPDHHAGGGETFRQIQEAYSVLGDTLRRRNYERKIAKVVVRSPIRSNDYSEPEPLIPEDKTIDMGEISPIRSFQSFTPSFDEIFDRLWRNFPDLGQSKSGRIQNMTLEVTLTPQQVRRGGNARIMVPANAVCPICRGSGGIGPYECSRCAGEGRMSGEIPITVAFPAGINQDHAVMIPLKRFGIPNVHLTVIFRPTDTVHS